MFESPRKSYTQRACAVTTDGHSAILVWAILLATNLPAFNSSLMLKSINCTEDSESTYGAMTLAIDCRYSTADGIAQLEVIEGVLRPADPQKNDSLEDLKIENTLITRWPSQICSLATLRKIKIDKSKLTELPNDCFKHLSELRSLFVENSQLVKLQDGLFDGLKKLEELSFCNNSIASIGLKLFSNRSDLLSLRLIDLGHNNLTDLEPWPFIRALAVDKLGVSFANNRISRFTNELRWSFVCGMKSFAIDLNLRNNQIRHLTDLTHPLNLTLMLNLVCLFGTKANSPFDLRLGYNPIVCDCNIYKFITIVKKHTYVGILNDLYCDKPFHLARQRLLTIMSDLENFVCEVTEQCPSPGRCTLVPANRTLIVSASNSGLNDLPRQLPPLKTERYKYQLDFSRNSIAVLSSQAYLANDTYSIDVSQSSVETVTDEAWRDFSKIKIIHLHGNRLTTLSPVILNVNYSFRSLSLYGNPLSCACQDSWMKHWLRRHKGRLEGTDNILCLSPPWLTGRVLSSVEDFEHCTDPNTARKVAIGTSTAIGITLVLGLLIVLTIHKMRIHLFAAFRFHPFDRDDCEGEEMDHDVFITCSHEDRSHAFKVLRLLEDNKFKVCYHERDFMVGQTIADNICQAVFRSRRVLCLVSRSFVDSSYCVYEFETALDHNVKLKRKRVVVLLLEKIDVQGSAVPRELQQYLSSHTVVEYWASNWANNLLYAMPTKPMIQTLTDGDCVHSS